MYVTFPGEETDEVEISYMSKKSENIYMWPDKVDTLWESIDSISKLLTTPTLSSMSTNDRHYFVFQ